MQKIRPKVDADDALNMIDEGATAGDRKRCWSEIFHTRWRRPYNRNRPCGVPADHRDQRDHLLRQPDFRLGGLRPVVPANLTTWAIAASTSRQLSLRWFSWIAGAVASCCSADWSEWN